MKTKILFFIIFLNCIGSNIKADERYDSKSTFDKRNFSKEDIMDLCGPYLNTGLKIDNPAVVDVDKDGDFDILVFKDGRVEFYKNNGTLYTPEFVLENKNYDSYESASFLPEGMPMPIFFADKDGDGDVDMFAVKKNEFNYLTNKYDYRVTYAANHLDIDTATLITIILILVIVLLVLAIVR